MKGTERIKITNGDLKKWEEEKKIVFYISKDDNDAYSIHPCIIKELKYNFGIPIEVFIRDIEENNDYIVLPLYVFESKIFAADYIVQDYAYHIQNKLSSARDFIEESIVDHDQLAKWVGVFNGQCTDENNKYQISYRIMLFGEQKATSVVDVELVRKGLKEE